MEDPKVSPIVDVPPEDLSVTFFVIVEVSRVMPALIMISPPALTVLMASSSVLYGLSNVLANST